MLQVSTYGSQIEDNFLKCWHNSTCQSIKWCFNDRFCLDRV